MKRWSLLLAVTLSLLLLIPVISYALPKSDQQIVIMVDSKRVEFQQEPILKNNTLLVPLKEIFAASGAKVTEMKKASVYKVVKNAQNSGTFTVGSKVLVTSKQKITMPEPAQIINETVYVPLDSFTKIVPAVVSNRGYWDYAYQTFKSIDEKLYVTDLKGKVLKEAEIKMKVPTEVIKYEQEITRYTLDFLFPIYRLTSSRVIKENGVFKDAQMVFYGDVVKDQVVGSYNITIRNQKTKKEELNTGFMALNLSYKNGKVDFNVDKALQLYKRQPASISVDDKPIVFNKKLIMKGDHLLVPLVEGVGKLGYRVEEVDKGKKYKVTGDENETYYLEVGKNTLIMESGDEININYFVPAVQIIDKTVMFPFDFVSWFSNKRIEGDFPNYRMYTPSYQDEMIFKDEAGNVLNDQPDDQLGLQTFEHSLTTYTVPGKLQDYRLDISRNAISNGAMIRETVIFSGKVIDGFVCGSLYYLVTNENYYPIEEHCEIYLKLPIKSGKVILDIAKVKQIYGTES